MRKMLVLICVTLITLISCDFNPTVQNEDVKQFNIPDYMCGTWIDSASQTIVITNENIIYNPLNGSINFADQIKLLPECYSFHISDNYIEINAENISAQYKFEFEGNKLNFTLLIGGYSYNPVRFTKIADGILDNLNKVPTWLQGKWKSEGGTYFTFNDTECTFSSPPIYDEAILYSYFENDAYTIVLDKTLKNMGVNCDVKGEYVFRFIDSETISFSYDYTIIYEKTYEDEHRTNNGILYRR